MSLTEQATKDTLRDLNENIWSRNQAVSRRLYNLGYDLEKCVVFEIFSDSGSTWIVRLMDEDEELIEIDLDTEDLGYVYTIGLDASRYGKRSGKILLGVVREMHKERNGGL